MAPSVFAGYLSLLAQNPQAINEKVIVDDNPSVEISPIRAVMGMTPMYFVDQGLTDWPTTPEEVAQLGPASDKVGSEWVAAILMANGADPWEVNGEFCPRKVSSKYLYHPVVNMVAREMPGLLRNAFKHPNALPVDEFAELLVQDNWGVRTVRVHALLSEEPHLMEVLLDAGMSLPTDEAQLVSDLSQANLPALKILADRGLLRDIPSKLAKRINNAWARRIKNSDGLTAETMYEMAACLVPSTTVQVQNAAAETAKIDGILSAPWGELETNLSHFYGMGIDALNHVATSKTQHKGNWSTFGAIAMHHFRRCSSNYGSPSYDISKLIDNSRQPLPDLSTPQYRGCLAPSIAVQWREGITMAAPVLMATLTRSPYNLVKKIKQDVDEFCLACAVEDFDQFIKNHANELVLFTTGIMKKNSTSQNNVLLNGWKMMLSNPIANKNGLLANAISEENKINLLLALTGNFIVSNEWKNKTSYANSRFRDFQEVFFGLFPDLKDVNSKGVVKVFEDLTKSNSHNSIKVDALLAYSLANHDTDLTCDMVQKASYRIKPKSVADEMVKMWLSAAKKKEDNVEVISKVKQILLSNIANSNGVIRKAANPIKM